MRKGVFGIYFLSLICLVFYAVNKEQMLSDEEEFLISSGERIQNEISDSIRVNVIGPVIFEIAKRSHNDTLRAYVHKKEGQLAHFIQAELILKEHLQVLIDKSKNRQNFLIAFSAINLLLGCALLYLFVFRGKQN